MTTRADAPAGDNPELDLFDATGRLGRTAIAWLREHTLSALSALGASGEVRVRIVGDQEMALAHERYSGVSGTTDVLTFDLRDGQGDGPLDTDLLVCFDEASRRADELGHGVERELLLYIVHGVLHCLGHNDTDEASSARMHAEEDRVLQTIGVGAVYQPGRSKAGGGS
ncbi:MAG: rRNA maturation RNase YbeY [Phycisphaerales bacterium]|nr:rRNA maturation RNase YbeY [Phycisphaerales bacterium]